MQPPPEHAGWPRLRTLVSIKHGMLRALAFLIKYSDHRRATQKERRGAAPVVWVAARVLKALPSPCSCSDDWQSWLIWVSQKGTLVNDSGFHQESFFKSKFKTLPSVGKLGRAPSSAVGTARRERVNAGRHKNNVVMGDHRSTIVRHGLFSARSMQVTLPDKNPPPSEAPKEPIISFFKCLQFAGWSFLLELVLPRGCTLAGLENTVLMYSCQIQLVPWIVSFL